MFRATVGTPPDVQIQKQLTAIHIDEWLKEDVFQLRWWLLLFLLFLFLFIWWKMADKSIIPEVILYAALTAIPVMAIVEYGEELTLWGYPTDIIPIFPPLTSINLFSLPLIYSLVYQYFRTWKSFIPAVLLVTGIICFVFEPILAWGGFFQLIKWKYYFSFPIYVLTAIFIRLAVLKIISFMKADADLEEQK